MKQRILIAVTLIAFIAFGVTNITKSENKVEFQKVQLQSREAEIKQLQIEYQVLDKKQTEAEQQHNLTQEQLQQLNKEKEDLLKRQQELEAQLSAKREAQRIAEQKVQQAASVTATASASSGSNCELWLQQAGIPLTQATKTLIIKESGCRTNAVNRSSGACGIPQAYPCSKLPCPLNDSGAVCQLKWMDSYVKGRYGSWDNALATWYSRCGSAQGCWY